MTAVEFIGRLEGAKKTGTGWTARCPGHDDQKASLSISEGKDHRILLHCHAGCTAESILAAMGLKFADLFVNGAPNGSGGLNIVAEYPYEDENGKLLYQVVRLDPKDFLQRKPDRSSLEGWTWNVRGVRLVLFHLPQLLVAVKHARPIYIVEGEKDALAMERAGFPATCNSGGAGKWRDSYNEALRGADAIIIADKDEHGRKHAQHVAHSLHGIAGSV